MQIFPHHENELAQSEAACCDVEPGSEQNRLARFWLHNGFVNINNEKMCAPVLPSRPVPSSTAATDLALCF